MKIDDVKRILVVGAGQMGAQIAMQSALHGYAITLNDLTMDVLQKGMAGNRKQLERRVQKGPLTRDQMEEAIALAAWMADLKMPRRRPSSSRPSGRSSPRECFATRPLLPPQPLPRTRPPLNSQIAPSPSSPPSAQLLLFPPL